ncbi:hypothetical protein [Dysgonomonas sp. 521]|uniref:hypothetical protein n=1 Tax=Dysgonomonas sp. 521 TaxID=2302932 RepID=UPI0013D34AFF|nr:hypothetical protein [Dysgonomonas sp. 521]
MKCNAQYERELWTNSEGGPIIGRISAETFYFAGNGEFYYGNEKNSNTKSVYITENGELHDAPYIYSYSGKKYTYNSSSREILLYVDLINTTDSIFVKKIPIDDIYKGQWSRQVSDNTFVMLSNPVIFRQTVMSVEAGSTEYDPFDVIDKSNIEKPDQEKILEVIRGAKYFGAIEPDKDKWISEADFTLRIAGEDESVAWLYIQKENRQIYVITRGWISDYSQFYEMSEVDFARLIEIAEKYKNSAFAGFWSVRCEAKKDN